DRLVAVDYLPDDHVLYPVSIVIHAIDRQHLLNDFTDGISNKFRLSIKELHTVTKDEIVTSRFEFSVHSFDELQTIVNSILSVEGVDEVSFEILG
ncbi:MAG: bifunctional (p)ppGpp synthetase/guanosine-3',5'-bis(diphosphate) 3'-pyrophosphohydrolase, partial [Prevotella sp.]|nr:bifunctional (p)ppGpp synthetase/guanosine-3',5'-bis(diphosphate) 3'-pyrophosphohydrolase [Prevotella sp.]MCI7451837.1 bifunctional (p)ppGpp synthetase/guanosine-3',5'-bis(diphosphate) 3'-pyrophosphohydrolase [Prevotella sp.]